MRILLIFLLLKTSLIAYTQSINVEKVNIEITSDFTKSMKLKSGKLFFDKLLGANKLLFCVKSKEYNKSQRKLNNIVNYYVLDIESKQLLLYDKAKDFISQLPHDIDSVKQSCIDNEVSFFSDDNECLWWISNYGSGISKSYLENNILVKKKILNIDAPLATIHDLDDMKLLYSIEGALSNDYFEIPYVLDKNTLKSISFDYPNKLLRIYDVRDDSVLAWDDVKGLIIGKLSKRKNSFIEVFPLKGMRVDNSNLILVNENIIVLYGKYWSSKGVIFVYHINSYKTTPQRTDPQTPKLSFITGIMQHSLSALTRQPSLTHSISQF